MFTNTCTIAAFPFWGVWVHRCFTQRRCSPRKSKYAKQFTAQVFPARFDAGRYRCGLWRYWHERAVFHADRVPLQPFARDTCQRLRHCFALFLDAHAAGGSQVRAADFACRQPRRGRLGGYVCAGFQLHTGATQAALCAAAAGLDGGVPVLWRRRNYACHFGALGS